jgi:SAM-dependent methyltransferase
MNKYFKASGYIDYSKKHLIKIYKKTPRIITAPVLMIWGWRKYLKIFKFLNDYRIFKKLTKKSDNRFFPRIKDFYPIFGEDMATADFDRHYIYHPAWAARIIARDQPEFHVDISSILDFSTLVSAFVPVHFYDYRSVKISLEGLTVGQVDLSVLPFKDNEIKSISCMHVIEHVGLGRYGDPVNPEADLRAVEELKRVLAAGGNLLFVVPIGKEKLAFNAHRVYSYDQIISYFKELSLIEFVLIPRKEDGDLLINPNKKITNDQDYGCGCFWFKKNS